MPNPENTVPNQAVRLNDVVARLVGIPGFGIAIPNLTGLFGPLGPGDLMWWVGYVWFIALAFCIWQGNRWVLFQQRAYISWLAQPITKLALLVLGNVFYTAPLTVGWLWLWYWFSGVGAPNWEAITTVALVNVICVLFVAHAYETVLLIKERQHDQLEIERQARAAAVSELEALKQQVDPHFMFNSLNTLSHLIENEPKTALEYNNHLADVYRYILASKTKDLVPLGEELAFLRDYFFLLKLRFRQAIELAIALDSAQSADLALPPLALQMLVENAVKHNEFSAANPLVITLKQQGSALMVRNSYRPRKKASGNLGIGLQNLRERFELLVGSPPVITHNQHTFEVELPLLKQL